MTATLFFYGTLRHPPILTAVLGRRPEAVAAGLPGWRTVWAADDMVPILVETPGGRAEGLLICGLTSEDVSRLDFYEAGFGYRLTEMTVETAKGPAAARVYMPDPGYYRPGPDFHLDDWVAKHGAEVSEAAAEYLTLWPDTPPSRAVRLYPQILQRAGSRVRAAAMPAPVRVRQGRGAVEVMQHHRPYIAYFALEEEVIRFPRFDGAPSAAVNRAAFVSGDAVTVLPYDPVRDRVLMVEQFRFGAHLRGDPCPWSLEPIAGRIDGGETPEEAGRREAVEEAGLVLGRLIPAARYYPSPGAMTEYLFSYIALADLPDGVAGSGGLATEAEDIRGIVMSFDALMALVDSGEAENGPLVLSALALARMRDSLRSAGA